MASAGALLLAGGLVFIPSAASFAGSGLAVIALSALLPRHEARQMDGAQASSSCNHGTGRPREARRRLVRRARVRGRDRCGPVRVRRR
jgi:hypothetical protein